MLNALTLTNKMPTNQNRELGFGEPRGRDESTSAPEQSTRDPPKPTTAAERRKLRNRLSQQAFRARQTLEISELKQRLTHFEGFETDRNIFLARDNRRLRNQLWQCEKRLRSLQATLKSLVDSMSESRESEFTNPTETTHETAGKQDEGHSSASPAGDASLTGGSEMQWVDDIERHVSPPRPQEATDGDLSVTTLRPPTTTTAAAAAAEAPVIVDDQLDSTVLEGIFGSGVDEFLETTEVEAPPPTAPATEPSQQILPLANSLVVDDMEVMASTQATAHHLTKPLTISLPTTVPFPLRTDFSLFMVQSRYCQHIDAVESCVRTNSFFGHNIVDVKTFIRVLSSLLAAFVKVAWPGMWSWMTYTNGIDTLARLTAWRLAPGPDTFEAIPRFMRPTPLQLAVPHPAVIDWCVFPFVRDRLIQHHATDPVLDEVCGDIGLAYVLQADLAELVLGAQSLQVTLNVGEILHAMTDSPSTHQPVTLPAPSLALLLGTREYAWELYRHFDMGAGGERFLVDRRLFTKYPHLYEADNPSVADGVPLSFRLPTQHTWPTPLPLDNTTMTYYTRSAARVGAQLACPQLLES